MKFIYRLFTLLLVISASIDMGAENWVMFMTSPDGWTTEDGTVSISYDFNMNPIRLGGLVGLDGRFNINICQPYIGVRIKNNTDDFIYLDLAKTYILRNGEAELYQNLVTMSTSKDDKDGDATKKSLSQTVMPIPPHASKTLNFPFFNSAGESSGYEPFIVGYTEYGKSKGYEHTSYMRKSGKDIANGTIQDYTQANSPAIATISFAYSTSENNDKPIRITKDFYINEAVKVKSSKGKELLKVLPNLNNETNYFIIMNGNN